MKRILSAAIIVCLAITTLHAQPVLQWRNVYSTDSLGNEENRQLVLDDAMDIYQLVQSDVYINPNSLLRPVIRKLNTGGNELTGNVFTNNNSNNISLSVLTADGAGNTYAAGRLNTGNPNALYQWKVFKFNAAGSVLWSHSITTPQVESVAQTLMYDGGSSLYVSGYVIDTGYHNSNIVVKLDTAGNELWKKEIACTNAWNSTAVLLNSGGNIITTCADSLICLSPSGNTVWASDSVDDWSYNPPFITLDNQQNIFVAEWLSYTYRITKYGPTGTRLWQIDSLEYAAGFGELNLPLTTDSLGNLYAGSINHFWTNDSAYIYKISPQGNVLWRTLLSYDPVSLVFMEGSLYSFGNSTGNIWGHTGLQRLNAGTGNIEWTVDEGDTLNVYYAQLLKSGGAGSVLAASRTGNGNGYYDAVLEKYSDALGVEHLAAAEPIKLYPNPATSILTVSGARPGDEVAIYNLHGQCVLTTRATGTNVTLPLEKINAGFYLLKTGACTQKFIKQ